MQQQEALDKTMADDDLEQFVQDAKFKSEIVKSVVDQKTPAQGNLNFIIKKWADNFDESDVKFHMNLAIAKHYAMKFSEFNEENLKDITDQYEGCMPKVIEQIEKREEYKNEYIENLRNKKL